MKLLNWYVVALIFCAVFVFTACSKDDSPDVNNEGMNGTVEITTLDAQDILGADVTIGGTIVSENADIYRRAVCWGTLENPTIDSGNFSEDYNNAEGTFSFRVENRLEPNTTYYVRAYVNSSAGEFYGNQITFSTGSVVKTFATIDITTNRAKLRGEVIQANTISAPVGFVYSTEPNPTSNDNETFGQLTGTDTYNQNLINLDHNTTYYVRAYRQKDGVYYYGEEVSFKTTGYSGPAGGIVAFDKGEESDGWRYLEMYPETLHYDINWQYGADWGGGGTFITGTSDAFGTGVANTNLIVNSVASANCAAKLCNNFSLNGFNDWFLPSLSELLISANSIKSLNSNLPGEIWSSTELNSASAKTASYQLSQGEYMESQAPKEFTNSYAVLPMRRY